MVVRGRVASEPGRTAHAAASEPRVLMADVAVACELLRMIEQTLDREPTELLGRALVAPLRSSTAGEQVAAALLIDMFHRAAETLRLPDLAICFSEWVDTTRLGYVAQLWGHFPTLGDLLAAATQYIPVENSGLTVRTHLGTRCGDHGLEGRRRVRGEHVAGSW